MRIIIGEEEVKALRWHFQDGFGVELVVEELGDVFSAIKHLLKERGPEKARCSEIKALSDGKYQIAVNEEALEWIQANLIS